MQISRSQFPLFLIIHATYYYLLTLKLMYVTLTMSSLFSVMFHANCAYEIATRVAGHAAIVSTHWQRAVNRSIRCFNTSNQLMLIATTFNTVLNGVKPYKAEATHRIRTNSLCLLTILLLSYLLPLPSLPTALKTILVLSSHQHQRWSVDWLWDWICLLGTFELAYNRIALRFIFLNRNGAGVSAIL